MSKTTINFITGALTALLVPTLVGVINWYRTKRRIFRVCKILKEEYILPLENEIKNYSLKQKSDFLNKIERKEHKLQYFLENEIAYLNDQGKFEIIRMIEHTRVLLSKLNKTTNIYEFRQPFETKEERKSIEQYEKNKIIELEEIVETYKNTLKDYRKLKIDSF